MERVTGIGGGFFRSRDPRAFAHRYRDHLGIDSGVDCDTLWRQEVGPTVVAPFGPDTDDAGRPDQAFMLNFRGRDLDAVLARLRAAGAAVDEKIETQDNVGRFGWATDPEGHRFELWEPAPAVPNNPLAAAGEGSAATTPDGG